MVLQHIALSTFLTHGMDVAQLLCDFSLAVFYRPLFLRGDTESMDSPGTAQCHYSHKSCITAAS